MRFSIGFTAGLGEEREREPEAVVPGRCAAPVRSVVQVFFPERHMTLAYYNDRFDLRRGDVVYVDGKLEGLRGRVVDVSLRFKIKLSEYKRVVGLADTGISGKFFFAGSHFITFDSAALPYEKALTWFKAPAEDSEEYVSGGDGSSFLLDDLTGMKAELQIAERGRNYYEENKVVYLCVDGTCGRAIVEGTRPYELEFEYRNGEISDLVCSCFCSGTCKHEVAAMLQLRETRELIEKHYAGSFADGGYFAAVSKTVFFSFVVDGKETGSIALL